MQILTVIGARPQFIKAAAVSHTLKQHGEIFETLLHTGQHFDDRMSRIFFDELGIPRPKYQLDINSLGHGAMTGRMLEKIEEILLQEKPDWVMVYGDTNSTLAGALAATKLHIPVAHVEAGLRSFNKKMPEEINRVLTDHVSTALFAPTTTAVRHLKREGIHDDRVHLTGDVMFDAIELFRPIAAKKADVQIPKDKFILLTVHREENTSNVERLRAICSAMNDIAQEHTIVFPVHPRTRKMIEKMDFVIKMEMLDPVGYLEMLQLEQKAALIVTDSGGVQKEAYFNKVPCVTIRTETEWTELVETGWNTLVDPADSKAITTIIRKVMGTTGQNISLYGDGHASEKIANVLLNL